LNIPLQVDLIPTNGENEAALKQLHTILVQVRGAAIAWEFFVFFLLLFVSDFFLSSQTTLIEGSLICNNCGRVYPVANGIPNMLLNEDEV
jgi:uncharacterized protein YbaR (Trm112 family)